MRRGLHSARFCSRHDFLGRIVLFRRLDDRFSHVDSGAKASSGASSQRGGGHRLIGSIDRHWHRHRAGNGDFGGYRHDFGRLSRGCWQDGIGRLWRRRFLDGLGDPIAPKSAGGPIRRAFRRGSLERPSTQLASQKRASRESCRSKRRAFADLAGFDLPARIAEDHQENVAAKVDRSRLANNPG